jgi:hypothetical protein
MHEEYGEPDSEEIEEAVNEDTSLDSIVFDASIDDDDEVE